MLVKQLLQSVLKVNECPQCVTEVRIVFTKCNGSEVIFQISNGGHVIFAYDYAVEINICNV